MFIIKSCLPEGIKYSEFVLKHFTSNWCDRDLNRRKLWHIKIAYFEWRDIEVPNEELVAVFTYSCIKRIRYVIIFVYIGFSFFLKFLFFLLVFFIYILLHLKKNRIKHKEKSMIVQSVLMTSVIREIRVFDSMKLVYVIHATCMY